MDGDQYHLCLTILWDHKIWNSSKRAKASSETYSVSGVGGQQSLTSLWDHRLFKEQPGCLCMALSFTFSPAEQVMYQQWLKIKSMATTSKAWPFHETAGSSRRSQGVFLKALLFHIFPSRWCINRVSIGNNQQSLTILWDRSLLKAIGMVSFYCSSPFTCGETWRWSDSFLYISTFF